eukprot:1330796-Amorphochlora_amoeboformis.AAC.1
MTIVTPAKGTLKVTKSHTPWVFNLLKVSPDSVHPDPSPDPNRHFNFRLASGPLESWRMLQFNASRKP